jgi:hypothetical protein
VGSNARPTNRVKTRKRGKFWRKVFLKNRHSGAATQPGDQLLFEDLPPELQKVFKAQLNKPEM